MSDPEFNFKYAVTILAPVFVLALWVAIWGHWLGALVIVIGGVIAWKRM